MEFEGNESLKLRQVLDINSIKISTFHKNIKSFLNVVI